MKKTALLIALGLTLSAHASEPLVKHARNEQEKVIALLGKIAAADTEPNLNTKIQMYQEVASESDYPNPSGLAYVRLRDITPAQWDQALNTAFYEELMGQQTEAKDHFRNIMVSDTAPENIRVEAWKSYYNMNFKEVLDTLHMGQFATAKRQFEQLAVSQLAPESIRKKAQDELKRFKDYPDKDFPITKVKKEQ